MNTDKFYPDNASHIRQDPISKEWVIYSPSRIKRPHDWVSHSLQTSQLPYDKNCPFCPGNEFMLNTIIDEAKVPNDINWNCRAVPNKYPALSETIKPQRYKEDDFYLCMGGYGHHEVIIENPCHNKDIPQYSLNEILSVIDIYHKRYRYLMNDPLVVMVTIFRNHGIQAGTSLEHPHSQIIGSPTVPRNIRIQEQSAEIYYDDYGVCVYCDLIEKELKQKDRLIMQNRSFISIVPYAAKVPFEIWIIPLRHSSVFSDISDGEKEDLAKILKDILSKLYRLLKNPDYNYIIHSYTRFRANEPHLHWYLQIVPRLSTPAGFEMGSGFNINPSIPEKDADLLRD